MTRIDFYILQDVTLPAQNRFACRLAAKVVGAGEQALIYTTSEAEAREIDELLWHYPDRRFVPHDLAGDESHAPLTVSWSEPARFDGVLINLSDSVPGFFNRFHRVAEVIVGETRDTGRERYRFYRHRGYPLYDHHLDDWESESGNA
jgi:DNA polymerase-3 subunit chi